MMNAKGTKLEAKRKIAIVSSTRADWGLLSPIATSLCHRNDCQVAVIATNMHLDPKFGMTVNEIEADGFSPVRVKMECCDDSPLGRIKAMSECMNGMAEAFNEIRPDLAVVLGDRYEILSAATAAAMMPIPIAHIAGGAISEGAIDDSMRHAITKLASLHLTETEAYRQRVIAMGENPSTVVNTGAIGVWNLMNLEPVAKSNLAKDLKMDLGQPFAVCTFHPATLDPGSPAEQCRELLNALEERKCLNYIITYPNNDSGSASIIDELQAFAKRNGERVRLVKSLGARRYMSLLSHAQFAIGNSSSGIVEVPSAGIPSIDIGIRQRGRTCSSSVIHCGNSKQEISAAIATAMSAGHKEKAAKRENPYYNPNTLGLICEAIATCDLQKMQQKHFYDVTPCPSHYS